MRKHSFIGNIPFNKILSSAKDHGLLRDKPVLADAIQIEDLIVSGPEDIRSVSGVDDAQIIVSRDVDSPKSASTIIINISGAVDEKEVRKTLPGNFYHLPAIIKAYPDALVIETHKELERNERTNKIPRLIWR